MTIFVSSSTPLSVAVKDYASLVSAVQAWLARSDMTGPGAVDYFIQSAEDRIYDDVIAQNMGRGTVDMEQTLSGTITNGYVAIYAIGTSPISGTVSILATAWSATMYASTSSLRIHNCMATMKKARLSPT